jgi:hypothetical protein
MSNDGQTAADVARGEASRSEELQLLKQDAITLEEYLDDRVERAIATLGRFVSEKERVSLRELIRSDLKSDPVLAEYVSRVTRRDPRSQ